MICQSRMMSRWSKIESKSIVRMYFGQSGLSRIPCIIRWSDWDQKTPVDFVNGISRPATA